MNATLLFTPKNKRNVGWYWRGYLIWCMEIKLHSTSCNMVAKWVQCNVRFNNMLDNVALTCCIHLVGPYNIDKMDWKPPVITHEHGLWNLGFTQDSSIFNTVLYISPIVWNCTGLVKRHLYCMYLLMTGSLTIFNNTLADHVG